MHFMTEMMYNCLIARTAICYSATGHFSHWNECFLTIFKVRLTWWFMLCVIVGK